MKKQSKIKFFSCVTVPFLALIFGCGGNKVVKQNQAMAEPNKPVVYEKTATATAQRPAWTNQTTFYEDDVGIHFSGSVMGGSDYALTLRLAKSEAIKNLLESIEIKTRSEFSSVMHGNFGKDEDIGRYVTDAVAWTVENLRVSGIKQQNIYYEQTLDPGTHRVRYNAWVNLNISKADYIKAKTGAAEKLLTKALRERDEEAKQKALELLERLRTET
jgi:hypothetical protein